MANELATAYISLVADTSKLAKQIGSDIGKAAPEVDKQSKSLADRFTSGFSKVAKTGMAAAGGLAATALVKGFGRLKAIDEATAKFEGLGYQAKEVDSIMSDVVASVKGTAFGTNEAADAAAMALASGIKPGKDLQRTLGLVGDAAAFANRGFEEIAPLFTKVADQGKLSGQVLTQFSQNSIPLMQGLQEVTGKTAEEVRKMASNGEIDFATFQEAMEKSIGGSALRMGDTFSGAMKNAGAALGRLGEAILDTPFKMGPEIFGRFSAGVDTVTDKVRGLTEYLSTGEIGDAVKAAFGEGVDENTPIIRSLETVRQAFSNTAEGGKVFFAAIRGEEIDSDLPWAGSVARAGGYVADTFNRVKDIFIGFFGLIKDMGPAIGGIAGSLSRASASVGISVWEIFLTTLEALVPILRATLLPAIEILSGLMNRAQWAVTGLVGAFTAWKVITLAQTGYTKALTVAQTAWKAITVGWTKATKIATTVQKAFNAVMKANKFMLIVTAITAVVAALTWFFTKTETGRKILGWLRDTAVAVWDKIKGVMAGAWNVIKAIFDSLKTAIQHIGDIFVWLWQSVIVPVWDGIGTAISTVWESIVKPIFDFYKSYIENVVVPAFSFLWDMVKRVFDGIGKAISYYWNNIIKPVFSIIASVLKGDLSGAFQQFKDFASKLWQDLGAGIKRVWDAVIRVTWDALKAALSAVGDAFKTVWHNVIKPVWDALGTGISWVIDKVIKPAFNALKTALSSVGNFFEEIVNGIKTVWDKLKGYLATPINFMIGVVWNKGILRAWNTIADFIPGLNRASELDQLSEGRQFAKGGGVFGPGTGTSDSIAARLSHGEHVWTADEVRAMGGHGVVYALRALVASGMPFTWDAVEGLANYPQRAIQTAAKGKKDVDVLAGLDTAAIGFKDGGAVEEPHWVTQLARAHEWAKARHGRPYVFGGSAEGSGGTDCSGFMSGIADVIQGGDGRRQWATAAFSGGGNTQMMNGPQGFVGGLGPGFSIGVTNGGPGGGHTAGTLGAARSFATVNVESGGSPSKVKYSEGAAGADDPQFKTFYHLPIGADGSFVSAGGPSPEQKRGWLLDKVKSIFDEFMNPIKDSVAAVIGEAPPEWFNIPPKFLDHAVDSLLDELQKIIDQLGDMLSSAWDAAKDFGSKTLSVMTFGLFDNGGWLQPGISMVANKTGIPEPVLNPDQWRLIEQLIESGVNLAAVAAGAPPVGEAIGPAVDGAVAVDEFIDFVRLSDVILEGQKNIGDAVQGGIDTWVADAAGVFGLPTETSWSRAADEYHKAVQEEEQRAQQKAQEAAQGEASSSHTAPSAGDPTYGSDVEIGERMVEVDLTPEYDSSAGASQWEGVVKEALGILREPLSNVGRSLQQIDIESGGNPQAVNRTDSNAAKGTPSVGLLQVIEPTYKSVILPDYDIGPYMHGVSIDPLANTLAGMGWAKRRYGSLSAIWPTTAGYDNGGWLKPGLTLVENRTGKPEPVFNPQQWQTIEQALDQTAGNSWRPGMQVTNNVTVADQEGFFREQRAQQSLALMQYGGD